MKTPHSVSPEFKDAIDEQRRKIFEAIGIIQCASLALEHESVITADMPYIDSAIDGAAGMLDRIANDLEIKTLRERAIQFEADRKERQAKQ